MYNKCKNIWLDSSVMTSTFEQPGIMYTMIDWQRNEEWT